MLRPCPCSVTDSHATRALTYLETLGSGHIEVLDNFACRTSLVQKQVQNLDDLPGTFMTQRGLSLDSGEAARAMYFAAQQCGSSAQTST
jgi:hypothetical protein